jgi:hypothetical protein
MSSWLVRATVYLSLAAAFAFWLPSSTRAQPPEKGDEAGKKFTELKDRLAKMVPKLELLGAAGELELARQTSPAEAKITLFFAQKDIGESASAFVYLRYYDGKWTTTHWEGHVVRDDMGNQKGEDPSYRWHLNRIMTYFVRALDKSS